MQKTNIAEKFKEIRDIPYKIPLSLQESDTSCSGKSKRLLKIFQESEYEARYRVCAFSWNDLKLSEELRAIPHENECTHVYLEVKIEGEWRIVDATWDMSLEGLLPVNEWGGKIEMVSAVPIRKCFSLEESAKIMQESSNKQVFVDDMQKNGKFYQAFNEWLEEYRKQNEKV